MQTVLEQLKQMTVVVADTGDVEAIKTYTPVDCTTNPSVVLGALKDPASEELVAREIEAGLKTRRSPEGVADGLTVAIGAELMALVPGRVSTEVDARLSFDTKASVERAQEIIADYANRGIGSERILIKLASTWEGIRAAEKGDRLQPDPSVFDGSGHRLRGCRGVPDLTLRWQDHGLVQKNRGPRQLFT